MPVDLGKREPIPPARVCAGHAAQPRTRGKRRGKPDSQTRELQPEPDPPNNIKKIPLLRGVPSNLAGHRPRIKFLSGRLKSVAGPTPVHNPLASTNTARRTLERKTPCQTGMDMLRHTGVFYLDVLRLFPGRSASEFYRDRLDLKREFPKHPLRPHGEPDDGLEPLGRGARLFPRQPRASVVLAAFVLVAIRILGIAFACEFAPVRREVCQRQAQDRPAYALRGRFRHAEVCFVHAEQLASAVMVRRCGEPSLQSSFWSIQRRFPTTLQRLPTRW